MSRVSILDHLYGIKNRKDTLDFNYDDLIAPPIMSIFCQNDINKLYQIATSLRYNANIEKKYELIDEVMKSRGFRRAHCGTNRVVYESIYDPTFVAKVAIDKVGMKDSPAEFINQNFFKPFCCKIFEVDPTGVLAFVERVNPITSLEEFLSVADDVFNMMITKIIGKYVIDDLGTKKFMNYGVRYNTMTGHTFGPVIIDFPYAYELDGAKLICQKPINNIPCGGEIDYDIGFNNLICTKCGKKYSALDLKKETKNIRVIHGKGDIKMRARIKKDGKVIYDSGISTKTYISKEDYYNLQFDNDVPTDEPVTIDNVKMLRRHTCKEYYDNYYYNETSKKFFEQFKPKNTETKIIKVNNLSINDKKGPISTPEKKYGESITISKVIDYDTNQVMYEKHNLNAPEPVEEETDNDIIVNDTVESHDEVITEESEITAVTIEDSILKDRYAPEGSILYDNDSLPAISIPDSTKNDIQEVESEDVEEMKENDNSSKEDKYVSILDFHGDDANYNMKQRRANKRKEKKHYKNRNHGFNNYDDDDMDNF